MRFKKYKLFRIRRSPQHQGSLSSGPLKVNEIINASEEIVKLVQKDSCLLDPFAGKGAIQLERLNPEDVEGIVRVGVRLDDASLASDLKHSAILPEIIM